MKTRVTKSSTAALLGLLLVLSLGVTLGACSDLILDLAAGGTQDSTAVQIAPAVASSFAGQTNVIFQYVNSVFVDSQGAQYFVGPFFFDLSSRPEFYSFYGTWPYRSPATQYSIFKFTAEGAIDTTWGTNGRAEYDNLTDNSDGFPNYIYSPHYMANDDAGNLYVVRQSSTRISTGTSTMPSVYTRLEKLSSSGTLLTTIELPTIRFSGGTGGDLTVGCRPQLLAVGSTILVAGGKSTYTYAPSASSDEPVYVNIVAFNNALSADTNFDVDGSFVANEAFYGSGWTFREPITTRLLKDSSDRVYLVTAYGTTGAFYETIIRFAKTGSTWAVDTTYGGGDGWVQSSPSTYKMSGASLSPDGVLTINKAIETAFRYEQTSDWFGTSTEFTGNYNVDRRLEVFDQTGVSLGSWAPPSGTDVYYSNGIFVAEASGGEDYFLIGGRSGSELGVFRYNPNTGALVSSFGSNGFLKVTDYIAGNDPTVNYGFGIEVITDVFQSGSRVFVAIKEAGDTSSTHFFWNFTLP